MSFAVSVREIYCALTGKEYLHLPCPAQVIERDTGSEEQKREPMVLGNKIDGWYNVPFDVPENLYKAAEKHTSIIDEIVEPVKTQHMNSRISMFFIPRLLYNNSAVMKLGYIELGMKDADNKYKTITNSVFVPSEKVSACEQIKELLQNIQKSYDELKHYEKMHAEERDAVVDQIEESIEHDTPEDIEARRAMSRELNRARRTDLGGPPLRMADPEDE